MSKRILTGKNIVLTGCQGGIGMETLKTFAECGANIFAIAYLQNEEFESFCKELVASHEVFIWPMYLDATDNASIRKVAAMIHKQRVEIHGLVHVIGINKDAFFQCVRYQDMVDTFQVNFFSEIIFSQYIVKLMEKRKTPGSIVFTSSISATDGNIGQLSYSASKAALIGAMKTLALELGSSGIRVNIVAPGVISSPMTVALDVNIVDKYINTTSLQRIGKPKEVADAYTFLMSDLSTHITGQVIYVDGGIK